MVRRLSTDYLVVGAGAMGMAFVDALIDHADVDVVMVDRRHAAGGHWLDAYPFVRLHQASSFYGVASTVLGTGAVQESGPEAGLHERAGRAEVVAYFDTVMNRRLLRSGRVRFLSGHEYRSDGTTHTATSLLSGDTVEVEVRRRVVDATYLAPRIPATTPPPFEVAEGVRCIPVGQLGSLVDAPPQFVVVGAGKTATDAIVWLVGNGVDRDRVTWVVPRDPWMLNRAAVQPDPAIMLELAADTLQAADGAESLEDLFLRLEEIDVLLRVDRDVTATMAKTPTLATWELELLRSIGDVVRLGHIRRAEPERLELDRGAVRTHRDALVVHCAAPGLSYPPMVPIWQPDRVRLQTIRAGAPCFGAALAGYVEATRDDDHERNRLCPPNLFGNTMAEWARMQHRGMLASAAFGAEQDIASWANHCALNPGRLPPEELDRPRARAAADRLARHAESGQRRLGQLADPAAHLTAS